MKRDIIYYMYTTPQKVAEYVGDCSLTVKQIEAQIKNASVFMDKHVGYKLGYDVIGDETKDLFFSGKGWDYIDLDNYWVNEYATIEYQEVDITDDVLNLPLNEDYINGIQKKHGCFVEGNANIKVLGARIGAYRYDWVNNDHTLPEDLTHACTLLVQSFIKRADPDEQETQGDIVMEKTSNYSIQYGTTKNATELETDAIAIINNYRQVAIG